MRLLKTIRRRLIFFLFQKPRIIKYILFSNNRNKRFKGEIEQPVLFVGDGQICVGASTFGVQNSPFFFSGYSYLDSRNLKSVIQIGNNSIFNNNLTIISEGSGVFIGNNVLTGTNVEIYDSNFHDLDPRRRLGGNILTGKVVINDNVFIGSNVKILKGVEIGVNSVIGNGSIVTKSIPDNVIACGAPCKIISSL